MKLLLAFLLTCQMASAACCTGKAPCVACKNCKYCRHCNPARSPKDTRPKPSCGTCRVVRDHFVRAEPAAGSGTVTSSVTHPSDHALTVPLQT